MLYEKGTINPVIPKYIAEIVKNVRTIGLYEYKLIGVNPVRPSYGITADLKRLEVWAKKNYADFKIVRVNEECKNYYGIFEMTDPVAHALERAGYLK